MYLCSLYNAALYEHTHPPVAMQWGVTTFFRPHAKRDDHSLCTIIILLEII